MIGHEHPKSTGTELGDPTSARTTPRRPPFAAAKTEEGMKARRPIVAAGLALALLVPSSPAVGPLYFYTVTPCRLVDTRDPPNPQGNGGPAVSASTARDFPVFGSNARPCGIPDWAKAAVLNFTIVGPTSAGHLIAYQYGFPGIPLVSNLNFDAGEPALANGALIELGQYADKQITVWTAMSPGAVAHLVIDVTGYYQ